MTNKAKGMLAVASVIMAVVAAVLGLPRLVPAPVIDEPLVQSEDASVQTPVPETVADPVTPSIETLRADADGLVVVAGAATPGSTVEIHLNDQLAEDVIVGKDGTFAAFVLLEEPQKETVLTLVQEGVAAPTEAIIAPSPSAPAGAPLGGEPEGAPAADPAAPEGEAPTDTPSVETKAAAPQVLIAGEQGVRLEQSAAPVAEAGNRLLETISYNEAGDLYFGGRADAEGRDGLGQVFVYVNNVVIGSAQIESDGRWGFGYEGVPAGRHILRVDRVDSAGAVMARIETPFQREAVESLLQAQDGQQITQRIVQPGHTLWAIAREKYGSGIRYVEVFEANRERIRNPHLIYPGQVFALPDLLSQ